MIGPQAERGGCSGGRAAGQRTSAFPRGAQSAHREEVDQAMYAYIIRRLWQMIPTMLGVILLVFVLFNWVGGDPAYVLAGKISNQEQIDNIRRQLGVDQPWFVQLWIFIKQVLTGDFGASWSTNEKVSHILATRLGPSLTVVLPLTILDALISIALALAVAYVRGSLTDRLVMIVCTVGLSISILVYIIVFQYVFAYKLGWFPVQGWGNSFAENLFFYSSLPILILLTVSIAPSLRLYRTFVLDEINQDYVRTGRAKGLSENRIMWLHVLRNASIPIITNLMASLPGLLLGAFLVERFFSIPGIGREVILAVERSDFPVIKALTVYVAFATMASNLLADLMYKWVDPRVQLK
jgi:peptide/nickel transport system permease protein